MNEMLRRRTFGDDRIIKQKSYEQMTSGSIIYDSDIDDGTKNLPFYQSLIGKKHVFILNFDQSGNIFGVYVAAEITGPEVWIEDNHHYLISIHSNNHMNSQKQWLPKGTNTKHALYLYKNDARLYTVGGFGYGFFSICKTNIPNSHCVNLSWEYKNIEDTDLTGNNYPQCFLTKRIIVIEAKH